MPAAWSVYNQAFMKNVGSGFDRARKQLFSTAHTSAQKLQRPEGELMLLFTLVHPFSGPCGSCCCASPKHLKWSCARIACSNWQNIQQAKVLIFQGTGLGIAYAVFMVFVLSWSRKYNNLVPHPSCLSQKLAVLYLAEMAPVEIEIKSLGFFLLLCNDSLITGHILQFTTSLIVTVRKLFHHIVLQFLHMWHRNN